MHVRIDTDLADWPESGRLIVAGFTPADVAFIVLTLWRHLAIYRASTARLGFIPERDIGHVVQYTIPAAHRDAWKVDKMVAALVDAGFLNRIDDGYSCQRFINDNPDLGAPAARPFHLKASDMSAIRRHAASGASNAIQASLFIPEHVWGDATPAEIKGIQAVVRAWDHATGRSQRVPGEQDFPKPFIQRVLAAIRSRGGSDEAVNLLVVAAGAYFEVKDAPAVPKTTEHCFDRLEEIFRLERFKSELATLVARNRNRRSVMDF